jgi:hypothetical protein
MDPITIATVTAAATVIGVSVLRGTAPDADKAAWDELQEVFGWDKQPTTDDLSATIAYQLINEEDVAGQVVYIIKTNADKNTARLLGGIRLMTEEEAAAEEAEGDVEDDGFNVGF